MSCTDRLRRRSEKKANELRPRAKEREEGKERGEERRKRERREEGEGREGKGGTPNQQNRTTSQTAHTNTKTRKNHTDNPTKERGKELRQRPGLFRNIAVNVSVRQHDCTGYPWSYTQKHNAGRHRARQALRSAKRAGYSHTYKTRNAPHHCGPGK